jgi:hypothetical protein
MRESAIRNGSVRMVSLGVEVQDDRRETDTGRLPF